MQQLSKIHQNIKFRISVLKENSKRYMPSTGFAISAGIIFFIGLIVFGIIFFFSRDEKFNAEEKNSAQIGVGDKTLLEIVEGDSDGDTVADWEEALWGTNKDQKATFDGMPDALYIKEQKDKIEKKESAGVEERRLTETEKFARDFFASYGALKTSGEVDKETINQFSSALGERVSDPNLPLQYSEKDAKTTADTEESRKKYYTAVQILFEKYKSAGIGEELSIVSTGMSSDGVTLEHTSEQKEALFKIAEAYKEFAKKVMTLESPSGILTQHLDVVNNSYNTGASIVNMSKMSEDPIVGLLGLAQYQKYSEGFIKSAGELEEKI